MTGPDARAFFETHFQPFRVIPSGAERGFLTGYYEPVVQGSLETTEQFTAPILPRPADLVTLLPGVSDPSLPSGFSAGRLGTAGIMETYPDRAAIEAFALTRDADPIVWLRDWTEVFMIQVQGSARVRLGDGAERRLIYAGRNGHPYTSIGKILIGSGRIAPDAMTLDVLKTWLRNHGQREGDEGRAVMQQNASYIFFAMERLATMSAGPIGGAGLPLTSLTSIAVDRTLWSYGLPFWIASDEALPGFGPAPLASLFIAQDTGSAIVGPARADLFLGTGDDAGAFAGRVRHPADFTVFLPVAA